MRSGCCGINRSPPKTAERFFFNTSCEIVNGVCKGEQELADHRYSTVLFLAASSPFQRTCSREGSVVEFSRSSVVCRLQVNHSPPPRIDHRTASTAAGSEKKNEGRRIVRLTAGRGSGSSSAVLRRQPVVVSIIIRVRIVMRPHRLTLRVCAHARNAQCAVPGPWVLYFFCRAGRGGIGIYKKGDCHL